MLIWKITLWVKCWELTCIIDKTAKISFKSELKYFLEAHSTVPMCLGDEGSSLWVQKSACALLTKCLQLTEANCKLQEVQHLLLFNVPTSANGFVVCCQCLFTAALATAVIPNYKALFNIHNLEIPLHTVFLPVCFMVHLIRGYW